jgi:exodeoxyribonuclease VII large subunit
VIARGGGSLERLQPFNSLEVAKAIYSSKIPVMTAVGHELDITIADLVADVRASVPMDAGQRLADPWLKAGERITAVEQNIHANVQNTLRTLDTTLTVYSDNLLSAYARYLTQCRKHLDASQAILMRCLRDVLRRIQSIEANFSHNYERCANRLTTENNALDAQEQVLLSEAGHFFTRFATRLTALTAQFRNSHTRYRRFLRSVQNDIAGHEEEIQQEAKRWYVTIARRITECENMLLACDPKLKLKQGFSIVKDKTGKVLKSSSTVAIDDIIHIELYDGILDSKVEDIR